MHILITIGYTGIKHAYLDLTMEEAIRRYTEAEGETPDEYLIKSFEFTDEFYVYDAYSDIRRPLPSNEV